MQAGRTAPPSPPRRAPPRRYIFGFRSDVNDNVAYTEDGAVVLPAGHNIVLYSPDIKTQRLIPGTLESEGITAMCVSSNKKLLAVAERSDKAIITVYDLQTLKRRKVLTAPEVGSKVGRAGAGAGRAAGGAAWHVACACRARMHPALHARTHAHARHGGVQEYVSLCFSADGKLLLAQGASPEWNMVLWVWEKSKVASSVKTTNQQGLPIHSVSVPGSVEEAGPAGPAHAAPVHVRPCVHAPRHGTAAPLCPPCAVLLLARRWRHDLRAGPEHLQGAQVPGRRREGHELQPGQARGQLNRVPPVGAARLQ